MEDLWLLVGALVAALLVILVILKLVRKGKDTRNTFLIVGAPNAGKTYLFTQLVHNTLVETNMSMKPNEGIVKIPTEKGPEIDCRIVDVPGHVRLRTAFIDELAKQTRGIIVLIDSVHFAAEVHDIAALLYDVLTNAALHDRPLLILCNKQDMFLAAKPEGVRTALEKELNTLRSTRSGELEGTEGKSAVKATVPLTSEEQFTFGSVNATFLEFTAKPDVSTSAGTTAKLSIINDWLQGILS